MLEKQLAGTPLSEEGAASLARFKRLGVAWANAQQAGRYPLHTRGLELLAITAGQRCLDLI